MNNFQLLHEIESAGWKDRGDAIVRTTSYCMASEIERFDVLDMCFTALLAVGVQEMSQLRKTITEVNSGIEVIRTGKSGDSLLGADVAIADYLRDIEAFEKLGFENEYCFIYQIPDLSRSLRDPGYIDRTWNIWNAALHNEREKRILQWWRRSHPSRCT